MVVGREEARKDVIEDGPQFRKSVFNRCTRQSNTEGCLNGFDGTGCTCASVFDVLCLVNDLNIKAQIFIMLDITFEHVVGSDQDFVFM